MLMRGWASLYTPSLSHTIDTQHTHNRQATHANTVAPTALDGRKTEEDETADAISILNFLESIYTVIRLYPTNQHVSHVYLLSSEKPPGPLALRSQDTPSKRVSLAFTRQIFSQLHGPGALRWKHQIRPDNI